jgi:ribosomal protein L29
MPKANELRSTKAEELRSVTSDQLRSFNAEDIRDISVEELEELCESPGDLGCSEQMDTVIPKEDTHSGTGLRHLDGKVKDIEARDLLGK